MTARSNGLRASAYALLLEIEESLGDPMLAALAARDIAAYVEPVAGPSGTTRLTLYVDVLQRAPAGVVLAGLTPAMAGEPPSDGEPVRESTPDTPAGASSAPDDAAFAALVEAFHQSPAERTWPDAEDLPTGAIPPGDAAPQTALPSDTVLPAVPPGRITKKWDPRVDGDRRRSASPAPAPNRPEPVEDFAEPADDEEHYSPPPLGRLEPSPFAVRWALVGLLLGVAMLIVPTLLDFGHGTSLDVAGVLCVVGSGAVLVSRLRDRSPDDPDDGAVV
jgi:hypothetical protein